MSSKKTKRQKTQTQKQLDKVNEKEKGFLQSRMKTNTKNFGHPSPLVLHQKSDRLVLRSIS